MYFLGSHIYIIFLKKQCFKLIEQKWEGVTKFYLLKLFGEVGRFKRLSFQLKGCDHPEHAGLCLPADRLFCAVGCQLSDILWSLNLSFITGLVKSDIDKNPNLGMFHRAGSWPNSGILLVCKTRESMQNQRLILEVSNHDGNKSHIL